MAKKKIAESPETPARVNYTVLARRYRPQQFADLVGQEPVAQALVNAVQTNRVAHAYLFCGTRGVGKTTTARILAKALNCVTGPTTTPCGKCESCQAIAAGEDVDVIEIDGASNRGIDDIRELRSNVQYRPSRSRYKIYIIDEVHQLTKESFNALVQTLEEPPSHVKFIFATTEVNKVPATILSRCQRFDFAGIGSKRIVEQLGQIVSAEGFNAEPEALEIIARRAAGSMRDAQSLLDQMLAFADDKLTVQQVHQVLGTADEGGVVELATAILEQRPSDALTLLAKFADEGTQLGELLDQLVDYWRDLMILCAAGPEFEGLSFPSRFRDVMKQHASATSLDKVMAGLDILAATKTRLRGTAHGRVLIEMALVRLCRLENLTSLAQIVQSLSQGRPADGPPTTRPAASSLGATQALKKNSVIEGIRPGMGPAEAVQPLTDGTREAVWRRLLGSVGPMFSGQLEKATDVAISGPNCLVLRFPARYNDVVEACQQTTRAERIEEALRRITGQAVQVRFELLSGDSRAQVGSTQADPSSRSRQGRSAALQEPLVRRAVQEFGAQILKTDEGFGSASNSTGAGGEVDEPLPQEISDV